MMFRNTPSRPIQSPHHAADGAYGGCRRADFGSALFRLDAPQPARDPGVQSLRREDGWERHHEDNRRERELAFGSSRLVPLYAALGSP
jgi:hypothetical protein